VQQTDQALTLMDRRFYTTVTLSDVTYVSTNRYIQTAHQKF